MKLTMERAEALMEENFGDLGLTGTDYTELPEGLHVLRDLNIARTQIRRLPRGLVVEGSLFADNSELEIVPDDLVVRGLVMRLVGTKVRSLPAGFNPGNNVALSLTESRIEQLPEGLHVRGLDLDGAPIRELPDGLVVHTMLCASRSALETLPGDIRVMNVRLCRSGINRLPGGLVILGNLEIQDTPIWELPDDLVVGGYLDIRRTGIAEIPGSIKVAGIDANIGEDEIPQEIFLKDGDFVSGHICIGGDLVQVRCVERIRKHTRYVTESGGDVLTDGKHFVRLPEGFA